jgi:uncharacterized RDD family membrane protein YckC
MLDTTRRVATPEGIELTLRLAGPVPRALAWLVDLAIRVGIVLVVMTAASPLGRAGAGVVLLAAFFVEWLLPAWFEAQMGGQTPGKRVFGIAVLNDDGTPLRWPGALTRNLLRAVDFLPLLYAAGCITMLFTPQHRRLGDLLAGTLLVREERFDLDKYTAPAPAPSVPVAAGGPVRLTPEDVELILTFLDRAPWLEPEARRRLGSRMVERFGGLTEAERAAVLASPESIEGFLRARAQAVS